MTRTVQQIEADINAINAEAKRLSAWSKQNQSPVDAGAQYMDKKSETFSALVEERFWAEWTEEVFATRRAAWNVEIMKHNTPRGIPTTAIRIVENKLGFRSADIGKAKARYVK